MQMDKVCRRILGISHCCSGDYKTVQSKSRRDKMWCEVEEEFVKSFKVSGLVVLVMFV